MTEPYASHDASEIEPVLRLLGRLSLCKIWFDSHRLSPYSALIDKAISQNVRLLQLRIT
jgi:hypothetical protein